MALVFYGTLALQAFIVCVCVIGARGPRGSRLWRPLNQALAWGPVAIVVGALAGIHTAAIALALGVEIALAWCASQWMRRCGDAGGLGLAVVLVVFVLPVVACSVRLSVVGTAASAMWWGPGAWAAGAACAVQEASAAVPSPWRPELPRATVVRIEGLLAGCYRPGRLVPVRVDVRASGVGEHVVEFGSAKVVRNLEAEEAAVVDMVVQPITTAFPGTAVPESVTITVEYGREARPRLVATTPRFRVRSARAPTALGAVAMVDQFVWPSPTRTLRGHEELERWGGTGVAPHAFGGVWPDHLGVLGYCDVLGWYGLLAALATVVAWLAMHVVPAQRAWLVGVWALAASAVSFVAAPPLGASVGEAQVVLCTANDTVGVVESWLSVSAPLASARLDLDLAAVGVPEWQVAGAFDELPASVIRGHDGTTTLGGLWVPYKTQSSWRLLEALALAGPLEVLDGASGDRVVINRTGVQFDLLYAVEGPRWRALGPLADGDDVAFGPSASLVEAPAYLQEVLGHYSHRRKAATERWLVGVDRAPAHVVESRGWLARAPAVWVVAVDR